MKLKVLFLFVSVLVAAGVLVLLLKKKPNDSRNVHRWILPNYGKVTYYEVKPSRPGFVAAIPQFVTWSSEKRGTVNSSVGVGGSYNAMAMHLSNSQTVAWITGQYAGGDRQFYAAIFDLVNFKVVSGECMWTLESGNNPSDIVLKHCVEKSSADAQIIKEKSE